MQRQIVERYMREVPFLAIPLTVVLISVLLIRFLLLPQISQVNELKDKQQTLPQLVESQQKLLNRLSEAGEKLPPVPAYETLEFSDAATFIHELVSIAKECGVTLNKTHPKTEDTRIVVQTSFTTTYTKLGIFLTALERYPLQLSVSQVALNRKGSRLEVTMTVFGSTVEVKQ